MSDTVFRALEPGDAKEICELIRSELGYEDITVDEVISSMEKMRSPDYFNMVAESGGEILGFISCIKEVSLEKGEYCHVLAIAVKSERQGEGLGKALVTMAESNARSARIGLVKLTSNFKRESAHKFYEALGYEKTSYAFKKFLQENHKNG